MVLVYGARFLSSQSRFGRLHARQPALRQNDVEAREWKSLHRIRREQFGEECLYSVNNVEWQSAHDSSNPLRRHSGRLFSKAVDGTCAIALGFRLDSSPAAASS